MALAKAENSSLPTTGGTGYLATPEDYIIEICEFGVSKTNPIKDDKNGLKKWDRLCHILFLPKKPVKFNVGNGKKNRVILHLNNQL